MPHWTTFAEYFVYMTLNPNFTEPGAKMCSEFTTWAIIYSLHRQCSHVDILFIGCSKLVKMTFGACTEENVYSVHKNYGNSNPCVNFTTSVSIIHHFIDTVNRKYHFPSPYQISDTFVKYLGSYGHWHDWRLNSKKCTSSVWIEIDIFLCDMEFRLQI